MRVSAMLCRVNFNTYLLSFFVLTNGIYDKECIFGLDHYINMYIDAYKEGCVSKLKIRVVCMPTPVKRFIVSQ